jgi:hypothetical protein
MRPVLFHPSPPLSSRKEASDVSIWQALRRELRGAWRSLHYDLGQRAAPVLEPDGAQMPGPVPGADPMATTRTAEPSLPEYEAYDPPPRRLRALAVITVATLVVLGAVVGGYFAVVGGVGALMSQTSPPSNALPAVAHPATATPGQQSVAAPGSSPTGILAAERSGSPSQSASGQATTKPTCGCVLKPTPKPRPVDPCGDGSGGSCRPPVPTPTGIPSASPSPSPSADPSPSQTAPSSAPPTTGAPPSSG